MESKLIKEEWRDVCGFEGLYKCSNWGRVKSLERYDSRGRKVEERIMKQHDDGNGYLMVKLCKDGDRKFWRVHRVISCAFPEICGEWFEGCEVDHINTIRDDNHADNLRVCTRKENSNNPLTLRHKSEVIITEERRKKISLALTGKQLSEEHKKKISLTHKGKQLSKEHKKKIGLAHINHPSRSKCVVQLTLDGDFVAEYPSSMETKRNGYNQGNIIACCRGKRKTALGYKWCYADDFYAQKEKVS